MDKSFRETFDLDTYSAIRDAGKPWLRSAKTGLIAVSGNEAVQFLNGLITNDIAKLEEGGVMLAAFPNAKGRLIAVVRVSREGDKFIFATEESTYKSVLSNLERFTLAGDFKVEDQTEDRSVVSVLGESAVQLVSEVLGEFELEEGRSAKIEFGGAEVYVSNASRPAGVDVWVPSSGRETIIADFVSAGAADPDALLTEVLRIESGIPKYGIDMNEETVVPEIGLEELISYQKGCYIGQEVIARIHFRGKVAKELKGVVFDAPEAILQTGDELISQDDRNAGVVTSKAYSPKLKKHIAMAYVRNAFIENGTELRVEQQTCRVVDLPFIE
ncbi:MAG: folate-binding protein [Acidobacteria bacterium]|nr:MAG: folate-binding protein [Acidobacteriota bacterium]REK01810.1 MAG: folate-binding protein [Acidobacteriota bacterium]REK14766.1 MAG: folate-binding protein [Acidobacteriota bacterium]REK45481.1 MAG: folate-binding protein [Acidobacteriota bacterium]